MSRLHIPFVGFLGILALAFVPACADSGGDGDGTGETLTPGDDDASSDVSAAISDLVFDQDGNSAIGDILIEFNLVGKEGVSYDLTASFQVQGELAPDGITLDGSLNALTASPSGVAHSVIWKTAQDIGLRDAQVTFTLSGRGDGVDLPPLTQSFVVENGRYDTPCTITVDPLPVQDGIIPIAYTLSDENGDRCSVRIAATNDLGAPDAASAETGSDPLEDIELAPGEVLERVFMWDSFANTGPYDAPLTLEFWTWGQYESRDDIEDAAPQVSIPVEVGNSYFPDEGQLIFTEVLFLNLYNSSTYIELFNTSNHTLDLSNVLISSLGTPDGSAISPDAALYLNPGEYALLSGSSKVSYPVTWVYGNLVLERADRDQLSLYRVEGTGEVQNVVVIDQLSYSYEDFSSNINDVSGRSIGLMSDFYSSSANDSSSSWCVASLTTPLVAGTTKTDYGTPGTPNVCQ